MLSHHIQGFESLFCCCCSAVESCLTLYDPTDCSTQGFPVRHSPLDFSQFHVHWVSDGISQCHPFPSSLLLPPIFPSIRVFPDESALCIRWPKYGVSASTPVLPMNTQDWSSLVWTGWVSLKSKSSQESSPTPQLKSTESFLSPTKTKREKRSIGHNEL